MRRRFILALLTITAFSFAVTTEYLNFPTIQFSPSTLSGSKTFEGNVTIEGWLNILSGQLFVSNILAINGSNIPAIDNTFELGNRTNRWKNLNVAGSSYLATANGSVGIGTASPVSLLDVNGGTGLWIRGGIGGGLSSGAGEGIRILSESTGNYIFAYNYTSSTAQDLILQNSGGNVGIGTTNPDSKLSITGNISSTTGAVFATSSGSVGINTTPGGVFHIRNAGSDFFVGNGRVGIGTTSPANNLTVIGTVYAEVIHSNFTQASYDGSDAGTVLYLPFSENSGTRAYDRSAFGTDATLNSGTAWNISGVLGPALSFDGINDYVSVPDSDSFTATPGNSLTVAAWVYIPSSPDDYDAIVGKWDNSFPAKKEWLFRFGVGDTIEFRLIDNATGNSRGRSTTVTIPTGVWTHVTGTYNGSTGNDANAGTKIYINGVARDTTDISTAGTFSGMSNTTSKLFLGMVEATTASNENPLLGTIDEVQIWKRVLSEGEIRQSYLRMMPGTSKAYVSIAGNVGINTTTPTHTLSVHGFVNISGSPGNSSFTGDVRIEGTLFGASPLKIGGGLNSSDVITTQSGIALHTSASVPTCNAANRGRLWMTPGGVGVADILSVCTKSALDAFAWQTISLL